MGVDTSIDEFFDERLQRILVVPGVAAESGSWYPPTPTETVRGPSDEVPDQPLVGSDLLPVNQSGCYERMTNIQCGKTTGGSSVVPGGE